MLALNSTDVRNDWSEVFDSVVREKPKFIKRTRDFAMLTNLKLIELFLTPYNFTAKKYIEEDNSITLSLNEIDLMENAKTEQEAKLLLANSILDYATDFYNEFNVWSVAPNRKNHIPYIFKALILDNVNKIGDIIQCQDGKS